MHCLVRYKMFVVHHPELKLSTLDTKGNYLTELPAEGETSRLHNMT